TAKAANSSASVGSGAPPGGGKNFAGTATFDSSGNVNSVSISNTGTGYSNGTLNVKLSGGSGAGKWSCNVPLQFTTGTQVSSGSVSNGGNYMSQPNATLGVPSPNAPTAPTGPTLTPTWSASGAVISISVATPGSGYMQPSYALTITACKKCSGSGAVATAA